MLSANKVSQVVEPECLKFVLDEMMAEYGIEILLHTTVVGAMRLPDSRVASVQIQERRGRRDIYAKAFIDCSGDGDLAFHCGASTRYGNHGTINLGTLTTRFGGMSASVKPTAVGWRNAIVSANLKQSVLKELIKKDQSGLIRLPLYGMSLHFWLPLLMTQKTRPASRQLKHQADDKPRNISRFSEHYQGTKSCIWSQPALILALANLVM